MMYNDNETLYLILIIHYTCTHRCERYLNAALWNENGTCIAFYAIYARESKSLFIHIPVEFSMQRLMTDGAK